MEKDIHLPHDYYEQFILHEQHFRHQYENAYFSKPVIYEVKGKGVAVAPWGNPGWATPVIFPYAHYVSITNLNAETFLYHLKDLLTLLKQKYTVTEHDSDPVAYIRVDLPDFMMNEQEEEEAFWSALKEVPIVKN